MLRIWLPMNGNLNNQGLTNAIITNTGATVNDNGKLGKCYSFGTGASYININKETVTDITGACSVCFWLNIISWNTSYATFFQFGKSNDSWGSYIMGLLRNNTASTCCFTISNGSTASNASYLTSTLSTGVWYHVCLVYQPGKCSIYLNGILDHEYTTTIIPNFSQINKITIGKSYVSYQTNCLMNDFRIYDHALSPKEVAEIAKGLVLHYKLDENLNVMNNCYSYPTFNTSATSGGWYHWGGSGHIGTYGQNTDKNYIFNKSNTYSHWISDGTEATKPYLVYQSPAFEGGYRSIQCIAKEENGLPITEDILYPDWNARDGGVPNNKWTSVTNLGNGFYLCKCEGIHQDGSNDLIGFYVKIGYKVYISEAYCENDKEMCSDIFRTKDLDVVWDCSGYCNNGIANGTMSSSNDTPVYNMSAQFDGTQYLSRATTNAEIKTLSAWFKTTKSKSTSQMICADSASKLCISLYSGTIISYFASGGGHSTGSKCTLGTSYKENDWNHVVVVKTGDGTRDVYCNGVKLTPTTNDYWTQSTGFFVGNRSVGGNIPFYGYISDVRAYATALTADQILQLYNTPISLANNGTLFAGEFVET